MFIHLDCFGVSCCSFLTEFMTWLIGLTHRPCCEERQVGTITVLHQENEWEGANQIHNSLDKDCIKVYIPNHQQYQLLVLSTCAFCDHYLKILFLFYLILFLLLCHENRKKKMNFGLLVLSYKIHHTNMLSKTKRGDFHCRGSWTARNEGDATDF